jgi:carbonic anhydrase
MPIDFHAVVNKKYNVKPITKSFIPTNNGTKQQILWVGCSDSLILETETLGVEPEEIFVHRNLGNILSNGDLSSASAVEWCLENLRVYFPSTAVIVYESC